MKKNKIYAFHFLKNYKTSHDGVSEYIKQLFSLNDNRFVTNHLIIPNKNSSDIFVNTFTYIDFFKFFFTKKKIDIVHIHGIWFLSIIFIYLFCKIKKIPYVIQCHGMVTNFDYSIKKKLFNFLFLKKILNDSKFLIATSNFEKMNIEKNYLKKTKIIPIKITSNFNEINDISFDFKKNNLIFIGRLNPIKNLENLILAWSQAKIKNWNLILVGPDQNNYSSILERLIKEYGLYNNIFLKGPIKKKEKIKLFLNSSILILPSYSENFGISIYEAMSCAVPVIASKYTPWSLLKKYDAGWITDVDVNSLKKTLYLATKLNTDSIIKKGINAYKLFNRMNNFDLEKKFYHLYNKAINS